MSPLRIKGSFTQFSTTPVGELSCSPTHDRYANRIFCYDQQYSGFLNDSFPQVIEVSLYK